MFGMDGYGPGVEYWQGTGEYAPKLDLGQRIKLRSEFAVGLFKGVVLGASHVEDFAEFGCLDERVRKDGFHEELYQR